MGTVDGMARTPKALQLLDIEIAQILASAIEEAGLSRRELRERTGMSTNRIGIILRGERPPSTVGEVGVLANAVGLDATTVISQAEGRLAAQGVRRLHSAPPVSDADGTVLYDAADDNGDPREEQEGRAGD